MKFDSARYLCPSFEGEKKKLVESKIEDLSLNQKYFFASLVLANDSVRSKYLEQIISHALTPMNYIGEGDVCDIWLSFLDLGVGLKGEPMTDPNVYDDEFKCSSISNGFGIEVKCSRNNAFDVGLREGYFIPEKNGVGFHVSKPERWSDFYVFVKFNNDDPKLDTSKGPFFNYQNYSMPEDSVEELFVVPTFMFGERCKYIESHGAKKGNLNSFITKDGKINRGKLKKFVSPTRKPNFRDPEDTNTTIRSAIAELLSMYGKDIYEYRKRLDVLKPSNLKSRG